MQAWLPTRVSFDVLFQRFKDGEAEPGGGEAMRRVLESFITSEDRDHHFARIELDDGGADVYLDGDDMMANHVAGQRIWDLLVEGALQAGWVIMPVGCPVCITDEAQRRHLPEGLTEEVKVVLNGDDLLTVIKSA
jgi:hypothetical protein